MRECTKYILQYNIIHVKKGEKEGHNIQYKQDQKVFYKNVSKG